MELNEIKNLLKERGIKFPHRYLKWLYESQQAEPLTNYGKELVDTLYELDIKRVGLFEDFGKNVNSFKKQGQLSLLVYPTPLEYATTTHNDRDFKFNSYKLGDDWDTFESFAFNYDKNILVTGLDIFYDISKFLRFKDELEYQRNYSDYCPYIYRSDQDKLFENIQRIVSDKLHFRLESQQRQFEEVRETLERLEAEHRRNYKEFVELKSETQHLQDRAEQVKNNLKKELQEVMKLPFITNIRTYNKNPVFEFVNIYQKSKIMTGYEIDDNGLKIPIVEETNVWIGKLGVEVAPTNIYIYNLSGNTIDGYPTPHTGREKIPCLGEFAIDINKKLINGDIKGLMKTIYSWATNHNDESVYISLQKWYDKTKKKQEVEQNAV